MQVKKIFLKGKFCVPKSQSDFEHAQKEKGNLLISFANSNRVTLSITMSNKEKNKEGRLQEAEKQMAEAVRSKAVAIAKMMHKQIEDIEKSRKIPAIFSLHSRILNHNRSITTILQIINSNVQKYSVNTITPVESNAVQNLIETYKSIREDFKDVMEMNDEKFKLLFPERNIYFKTREQAVNVLMGIFEQEIQISAYLSRKIF